LRLQGFYLAEKEGFEQSQKIRKHVDITRFIDRRVQFRVRIK
jgi:hypothetical protein